LLALSFYVALTDVEKIRSLYKLKAEPKPGDWLSLHEEKYYDLETYKNLAPSRPDSGRRIIYIYKLGETTRAEDSLLNITFKYLEHMFHLQTQIAQTFPISCVPDSMKRTMHDSIIIQICSRFILDTLVSLPLPKDAAAAICFTKYDLYPGPNWNFVFGQAYIKRRVGVWSFNRYGNANNKEEFEWVLRRTLKVASHETGHVFSIQLPIVYTTNAT